MDAKEIKCFFDLVVTSPLLRSMLTLSWSEIRYEKHIVCPLIREHRTDPCDFLKGERFEKESEAAVLERVAKFKLWLAAQRKSQTILLVGHADFFLYLTSKVVDNERFGVWLENGEIHAYDEDLDWFFLCLFVHYLKR